MAVMAVMAITAESSQNSNYYLQQVLIIKSKNDNELHKACNA